MPATDPADSPTVWLPNGDRPGNAPIGVFDSGVGGLSVLRAIRDALPHEALLYVADSGHAPYGHKSPAFVQARAEHIVRFLLAQGAKAVVVACNTVTGLSISQLREAFPQTLLVAIEPAVKPAAALTRSGTVGIVATHNTVTSPGLARLIAAHAHGIRVLAHACPGWVERVELGDFDSPEALAAVRQHVQPLLDQGADVLALGCTHYPFFRPLIEQVVGPDVHILDPAPAVARELSRRLLEAGVHNTGTQPRAASGWTSGPLQATAPVLARLWGHPLPMAPLP